MLKTAGPNNLRASRTHVRNGGGSTNTILVIIITSALLHLVFAPPVRAAPTNIDVIIIAGQSNAVGSGEFEGTREPDGSCRISRPDNRNVLYRVRVSTTRLDKLSFFSDWGPLVERELPGRCTHGIEFALVDTLLARANASEREDESLIAVLKVAVGGTRLLARNENSSSRTPPTLVWMGDEDETDNLPRGVDHLSAEIQDANAALRDLHTNAEIRIKAFVWIQGEHDVVFHDAALLKTYPETLERMINELFPGRAGSSPLIVPIALSTVQRKLTDPEFATPETIANFELFNSQLRALVEQNDTEGWATIDPLPHDETFIKTDNIHYTATALNHIGSAVGLLLLERRALD